jgi:hypothetical protein
MPVGEGNHEQDMGAGEEQTIEGHCVLVEMVVGKEQSE